MSQPEIPKFKYTRAMLTWDEIHDIERANKGNADVKKLIRHIRFVAHLSKKRDENADE